MLLSSDVDWLYEKIFPKRETGAVLEPILTYSTPNQWLDNNFQQNQTYYTAQKMKFSIKDFFSTFTEELLNGQLRKLRKK